MSGFSFQGASGKRYPMALLYSGNPTAVPNQGGVLVIAAGSVNSPTPVLIADAHSLNAAVHQYQLEASRRGADLLFVLTESKVEERAASVRDLRAAYGHREAEKTD